MGQTAISGHCYSKNGEICRRLCMCEVSSHRHSAYLTDIRRNASAGFGLHVERVPVAYQRTGLLWDLHAYHQHDYHLHRPSYRSTSQLGNPPNRHQKCLPQCGTQRHHLYVSATRISKSTRQRKGIAAIAQPLWPQASWFQVVRGAREVLLRCQIHAFTGRPGSLLSLHRRGT
jgi:hypothetical protein